MPRRKRARRRKHNQRNHFGINKNGSEAYEDGAMRTCPPLDSSTITIKISEELGVKTSMRTPSPDLELININKLPRSRSSYSMSNSPLRKRRSVSRESHAGYSGLPYMFNLSENSNSFITDLRTCQSSTILEMHTQTEAPRNRIRSSSSMAKLHSPGIEKIPLKTNTSTQTEAEADIEVETNIMETPRVNHDVLLELDYEVDLLRHTPVSGYKTPLKRMRFNNITPIFDMKDTAVRIQDLNNLQNDQTGHKALNCSRILNGDSLKRLQNFNELILNTSQSVDYDNCELPQEIEEIQDETDENHVETNANDVSGEISFFTPQLYNCKSASTPIEKKDTNKNPQVIPKPIEQTMPNKIEILRSETMDNKKPSKINVGTSTQDQNPTRNIAIQTLSNAVKFSPAPKIKASMEKSFIVSKRRSYKSLSPAIMYYKASPKRDVRFSPMHKERSRSVDTIATIETCARIIATIKKYHGKYSSKLPAKIIEICTWLGLTIKKGVTSLYKLYSQQKALNESTSDTKCHKCDLYLTQILALTTTVDELGTEINHMKQENKDKSERLSLLRTEVDQLKRELIQFESLKTEMQEIKERLAAKPVAAPPPPPPLPPPPLLIPTNPLANNRPTKAAPRKKSNENARPIISLDDILKVKLRKIGDRPSPLQRRATEPMVQSSVLKQIKLRSTMSRPQTPSSRGSLSGTSSLSNSPGSSLTRILTNVDTNVRRLKRLKRSSPYSFDDFSRRNRHERENYDSSDAAI